MSGAVSVSEQEETHGSKNWGKTAKQLATHRGCMAFMELFDAVIEAWFGKSDNGQPKAKKEKQGDN